jgi:hypothetical protein
MLGLGSGAGGAVLGVEAEVVKRLWIRRQVGRLVTKGK